LRHGGISIEEIDSGENKEGSNRKEAAALAANSERRNGGMLRIARKA